MNLRIFTIILFGWIIFFTKPLFAQIDEIQNLLDMREISAAKTKIDQVMSQNESKENPKAWYYKALVYGAVASDKIPGRFLDLYDNLIENIVEAINKMEELDKKPNAKGKVKQRWAKEIKKARAELINQAYNIAVQYRENGRHKESMVAFIALYNIDPDKIWYALIHIIRMANTIPADDEKVKEYCEKIIKIPIKEFESVNLEQTEAVYKVNKAFFWELLIQVYLEKDKNYQKADELIKEALKEIPEQPYFEEARQEIYKMTHKEDVLGEKVKKAEADFALTPGEGITGNIHQNNIGKIVFSNNPITRDLMNSNNLVLKKSFLLGEPIHIRAFLGKAINQYVLINTKMDMKEVKYEKPQAGHSSYGGLMENNEGNYAKAFSLIYLNDKPLMTSGDYNYPLDASIKFQKENGKFISTGKMELVNPNNDRYNSARLVYALNRLKPGKYTIKIELWGGHFEENYKSLAPLASGEFELIVPENNKKKVSLGVSFNDVQKGMTDQNLETKLLAMMQKYAKNAGWDEKFTKIKIASESWNIQRNKNTGIIEGRVLTVYVYAEWPDGHCSYQSFGIEDQHDGTKFMETFYRSWTGEQIDCDCLNK